MAFVMGALSGKSRGLELLEQRLHAGAEKQDVLDSKLAQLPGQVAVEFKLVGAKLEHVAQAREARFLLGDLAEEIQSRFDRGGVGVVIVADHRRIARKLVKLRAPVGAFERLKARLDLLGVQAQ